MKRQVLVSLLVLLSAAAALASQETAGVKAVDLSAFSGLVRDETSLYKPGGLIVRFSDTGSQPALSKAGAPIVGPLTKRAIRSEIVNFVIAGAAVDKEYDGLVPGLTVVKLPEGVGVLDAVVRLNQSANILYAELDYKLELAIIPNDTRFSELWGMNNTRQTGGTIDADIDAPEAWNMHTGSSSVIVAVTDTGVDYTHPDLAANIWVNTGEIPGNGIDDDGDGFIDDYYGCDPGNNDGDPMDDSADAGHGTHVSGTIGAVGNNAMGVAGVCWRVKIMGVKIADANGVLWLSAALQGIQYATSKHANVMNASWGGYGYSQALYDAIASVRNAGILFVAGAGNDSINNDALPFYPASYNLDNIISVMATSDTDGQAYYSNYGLTSVDLGAPGGVQQYENDPRGILSTLPGNQYGFYQGTSMAAPHVAGACALIRAAGPNLTYSQVKSILLATVDPTLPGLCVSGGRLNLFNAIYEIMADILPPSPDPAEWEIEPQATGLHTIAMEAKAATDRSGVEYFFKCVTNANFDSGWQSGPLYERGDFGANTTYTFRVKYRDKSENWNETGWSAEKSTKTASGSDILPPFPNPSRWKIKPKVVRLQPTPLVRMSARTSTDENGPIQYYFKCTHINPPGPPPGSFNSGWISSDIYTISSGLTVGSTYTFTVKARDALLNETAESIQASVTVSAQGTNVLTVPKPYPTIQSAINAASNGDIVEVRPGTYTGTGNRDIDFLGKAITVRSIDPNAPSVVAGTIIDVEGIVIVDGNIISIANHRAFDFHNGEGSSSILAGFTITNGFIFSVQPPGISPGGNGANGLNLGGGAINCNTGSSPTIRNCVITNCWVFGGFGGDGAPGDPGDPADPNQPLIPGGNGGNGGRGMGGGIYCDSTSSPVIYNCTISSCVALGGNGGDGGDGENVQDPNNANGIGGFGGNGNDSWGGGICYDAGSNAIISNCTISNCFALLGAGGADGMPFTLPPRYPPKGADGHGFGGGVYYGMGYTASTTDTRIRENEADDDGGGIYCGHASQLTLINCDISNNFCINGSGGGIWYDNGGTLTLNSCNVSGNTAADNYDGGGIYAGSLAAPLGTTVIIDSNSTISGNTAGYGGGGLFLIETKLTANNSTIGDNSAFEGAGVWAYNCIASVKDCTVRDNSAAELGGGFSFINGLATINNSIMTGNSASGSVGAAGGALFFEGWSNNPHQVTNCLITDNIAYSDGGGLSNNIGAWVQITNCTFVGNKVTGSSGVGGGISCAEYWAYVETFNSILWGNKAGGGGSQIAVGSPDGSQPYGDGPYADVDVRYSDVQGGEEGVWLEDETQTYTAFWWLGGNKNQDPLFATTSATEQTYFLSQVVSGQLKDSPCVNAGNGNASVLESIVGMPLTTRTDLVADSGTVDMGYHYEAALDVPQYRLTIEVIDQGYGTFGTVLPPWQPGTYTVNQGKVVELYAKPNDGWVVYEWTGTDVVPVYPANPNYNTVTMDSDKTVTVEFGPDGMYKLVTHVIGNGTIEPAGLTIWPPGTVVPLTATPANPAHRIKWTGSDNDFSTSLTNTATMNAHKEVFVKFYEPRMLDVPGDYTNIQMAINAANDGDIVVIAPGVYDIRESSLPYEYTFLYISGKAITLTSVNPDDPCTVAATVIYNAGFVIENVNRDTVINGLTIQSAQYNINTMWVTPPGSGVDGPGGHIGDTFGGGMELLDTLLSSGAPCVTSPDVRNCRFIDCAVGGVYGGNGNGGADALGYGGNGGWPGAAYGGGVSVGQNGSPIFTNCTFIDCFVRGGDGGNGGSNPPGHGGGWGDPNAPWWEYGPFEEYWKYTGYGGAVYCAANSYPEFVDCNFINNRSYGGSCGISGNPIISGWPYRHYRIDSFGGAVYAAAGSTPVFTGCTFINNEADVNGLLWHQGRTDSALTVNDDPYISYGGAIAFEDGANPTFNICSFSSNLATIGGGMWATWTDPNIVDCNFIQNTAFHGGGVYFVGGAPKITRSNFRENEALYDTSIVDPNNPEQVLGEGGAIHCFDANAAIVDCNVFNNAGYSGGGIYISGSSMSLVKNCLITGNFVSRDGGGVSIDWHSDVNIVNCTIADNRVSGGYGGGLYCSYNSYVNIINSIVWDNMGNIGAQGSQLAIATGFKYDPRPSTVNVTYSDVQGAMDPNAFGVKMKALDIVFCIDTTGSMFDDIAAVQAAAAQITSAIATKFQDFRIAVVDYKDFNQPNPDPTLAPYGDPTDYPYRTDLAFTRDTSAVVAAINSLTTSGGADGPEAVYTALMHCIDHNLLAARLGGQLYGASPASLGPGVWRSGNVMRVIILMGDAPPHDPEPFTNYVLRNITAAAVGGTEPKHIMPVLIGQNTVAASYYEGLARRTGGAVLEAAGAGEVVGVLLDAIDLISRIPNPIFVGANCIFNWDPSTYTWNAGSHNIDEDPLFIAGYYLSQFDANQPVESNCVDGGSDLASKFGLNTYTTRADSVPDAGIVDMGYHYKPFTTIPQYKLTINAIGVTVIEPVVYPPDYSRLYNWFTTVHLRISSTYDPRYYQVWWTGTDDDSLSGPSNTVTLDGNKTVTVRLVKTNYDLTIRVNGGNGRLSARWVEGSSSYTIKDPCTHSVKFGAVVQLTAEPDKGYRVRRWSSTDNDGSRAPNNTVTMNSDRTVSVEFGPPVTVTVPGDYPTIWDAVSEVEVGDTIVVEPGTYYGGYEGVMVVVDKPVVIRSRNPDDPCCVAATIIDGYMGYQLGQGWNNLGIQFASTADANTVLNGFTIQNCGGYWGNSLNGSRTAPIHPDGFDGGCGQGAAILIMPGASPTIKNCVIRNNMVGGGNAGNGVNADQNNNAGRGGWGGWAHGGAIYCSPNSTVKFINCQIIDNQAQGGNGGDGGDYQNNGGAGNYGGSWSINRGYNIPSTGLGTVYVDGNLWEVWQWDQALSYWPMYEEPTRTSYFGDYRWYSGYGGGVYCDVNSTVDFNDCLISGNTAQGGMSGQGGVMGGGGRQQEPLIPYEIPSYGGGVYCAAGASVTFTGCTITDNNSSPPQYVVAGNPASGLRNRLDPYVGHGGGVCAEHTASVVFTGCAFSGNEASLGAGTFWTDANASISDSNMVDNLAFNGGGIYLARGSSEIVGSYFSGNNANGPVGAGGAVYCFDANVLITDCNIAHNDANSSGGGLYFTGSNTMSVKNCLIINNSAGRDGGGVSANWYANAVLANCTLAGNAAPGTYGEPGNTGLGGGLYVSYESNTSVIDSIFWNNYALKGMEMGVGTGFEHDPRPAKLTVSYSDVRGGRFGVRVDKSCTLIWGAGNRDSDPLFVTGMFGDYYLSQTAVGDPNQTQNSPCVDAGSDYTGNVGMIRHIDPTGRIVAYTTRTDGELDHGKVDMGYHYRTVEPCRFCDLVYDGIINFLDYAVLAAHWLNSGCSDLNGWCGGADLTFDGIVNDDDSSFLTAECWLVKDTKAPIPNPSEWEIEPYLASSSSIKMIARTAFDEWGWDVEYYFDCVYGNCHDRSWQESRTYQDTGLNTDARYGYRVRARDELGNETEWSVIRYAGVLDTIPPAPAPTWAVAPYPLGPASIAMESKISYDDSGVSYGFWNVTNDPAGNNIVWQPGLQFIDVNLEPNATYGYRVKARDGSQNQNETAWSVIAYATTLPAPDITPPTPAAQWDLAVDANGYNGRPRKLEIPIGSGVYYATMRAVQAVDPSGVEYRFVCDDPYSSFSSQWQSQPAFPTPWTYQVPIGGFYVATYWRVIVRDQSPNHNQTVSEKWLALIRNPP